jgi:hypothetical protein
MNVAFLVVSATMLLAGVLWLVGMKYLPVDTNAVETAHAQGQANRSYSES